LVPTETGDLSSVADGATDGFLVARVAAVLAVGLAVGRLRVDVHPEVAAHA
jgi:hypothetical protein